MQTKDDFSVTQSESDGIHKDGEFRLYITVWAEGWVSQKDMIFSCHMWQGNGASQKEEKRKGCGLSRGPLNVASIICHDHVWWQCVAWSIKQVGQRCSLCHGHSHIHSSMHTSHICPGWWLCLLLTDTIGMLLHGVIVNKHCVDTERIGERQNWHRHIKENDNY